MNWLLFFQNNEIYGFFKFCFDAKNFGNISTLISFKYKKQGFQDNEMNGYYYTQACNAVVAKTKKKGDANEQKMIALADSLEDSIRIALERHQGSRLIMRANHFAMIGFPVKKDIEGRILITQQ
ncbi:hypothetical protein [Vibrio aestuarianus]|uniref:hypothetical protein n=1 Tax=Vibrio aestuarianus TaxID=28171 RepID=UPI0015C54854|nr:hypothetical protein [Vibrio aestuarianus]